MKKLKMEKNISHKHIITAARYIARDMIGCERLPSVASVRKHVTNQLWSYSAKDRSAANKWLGSLTRREMEIVTVGERENVLNLLEEKKAPKCVDKILDDIFLDMEI